MDKLTIIYLTIGIYAACMLAIGIFNARRSKSDADFTVGGRNAGGWRSAFSYGTAYFSAVMFVGYAGSMGYNFGLWATLVGIGNAIFGSWLAWLVLAKRTREISHRLNIQSMPQLFAQRFQSGGMKTFAAVIIFLFLTPYSASVYNGLTSVCSILLGLDPTLCKILIAVASGTVVILGGYLATLKADFVQGIVMVVGIVLLTVYVLRSKTVVEGGGIAGLWDMMAQRGARPLPKDAAIKLGATILMTSFGTWGLPQMIHKYYGIKDDKQVMRGTVISTAFGLIVAGLGYFVGSFTMMFFSGQQNLDNVVPMMLDQAGLPNVLLGIVLVLLISASVSTLGAITVSACSTLSMDLIKEKLAPNLSQKGSKRLIQVLCLLFIVMSYAIASTNTPILDMMSYSWGILSGSFLAPYMLSLYDKKLNKAGGWAGMLSGFGIAMVPALSKIITGIYQGPGAVYDFLAARAAQGPQFAVAAMLVSIVVCLVVSRATAKAGETDTAPGFYQTGAVAAE